MWYEAENEWKRISNSGSSIVRIIYTWECATSSEEIAGSNAELEAEVCGVPTLNDALQVNAHMYPCSYPRILPFDTRVYMPCKYL